MPPKRDVARALLLRGSVFVHLDPSLDEVEVPSWCKDQQQLVLHVGLDMPIPIPDLRVDGAGVFGTLSFQRIPFRCVVPWNAVYALTGDDGRGLVWPDSVPASLRDVVGSPAPLSGSISLAPEPGLRVVGDESKTENIADQTTHDSRLAHGEPAHGEPAHVELTHAELALARELESSDLSEATSPVEGKRKRKLPPYLRVVK